MSEEMNNQDSEPMRKAVSWSIEGDRAVLFAALIKAQLAYGAATKGALNPHFGHKYADLADVLQATRGALNANGFAPLWMPETLPSGWHRLTFMLGHESGGHIAASLDFPTQGNVHELKSAFTYRRRILGECVMGVAPEDDDDGNAAAQVQQGRQRAPEPPAPRKPQEAPRRPPPRAAEPLKVAPEATQAPAEPNGKPAEPPKAPRPPSEPPAAPAELAWSEIRLSRQTALALSKLWPCFGLTEQAAIKARVSEALENEAATSADRDRWEHLKLTEAEGQSVLTSLRSQATLEGISLGELGEA